MFLAHTCWNTSKYRHFHRRKWYPILFMQLLSSRVKLQVKMSRQEYYEDQNSVFCRKENFSKTAWSVTASVEDSSASKSGIHPRKWSFWITWLFWPMVCFLLDGPKRWQTRGSFWAWSVLNHFAVERIWSLQASWSSYRALISARIVCNTSYSEWVKMEGKKVSFLPFASWKERL